MTKVPTPTPWGYSVEVDCLPPLVAPQDFCAPASADPDAVFRALEAASAAVRSWCGWHVAPTLRCSVETSGPGRVIALPSLCLHGVSRVLELGAELRPGQFEWRADGLLRRCAWREWPGAWRSVTVEFDSGLDGDAAAVVAQVVAQVAASSLAAPAGVAREQAGDVSVTYSQPSGICLLDRDIAMLAPYRLQTIAG